MLFKSSLHGSRLLLRRMTCIFAWLTAGVMMSSELVNCINILLDSAFEGKICDVVGSRDDFAKIEKKIKKLK